MNNLSKHASERIEQRRSNFPGDFSLFEVKEIISQCAASQPSPVRRMINCVCEGVLVAKVIAANGVAITVFDPTMKTDHGQCNSRNALTFHAEV